MIFQKDNIHLLIHIQANRSGHVCSMPNYISLPCINRALVQNSDVPYILFILFELWKWERQGNHNAQLFFIDLHMSVWFVREKLNVIKIELLIQTRPLGRNNLFVSHKQMHVWHLGASDTLQMWAACNAIGLQSFSLLNYVVLHTLMFQVSVPRNTKWNCENCFWGGIHPKKMRDFQNGRPMCLLLGYPFYIFPESDLLQQ